MPGVTQEDDSWPTRWDFRSRSIAASFRFVGACGSGFLIHTLALEAAALITATVSVPPVSKIMDRLITCPGGPVIKLALRSVQGLTFVIAAAGAGSVQHPLELGSDNTTEQRQVPDVELAFPLGLGIGPDGSLYISERQGHRVRRIDLEAGTVTTVAGTGDPGFSGDGGPAAEARLRCPDSIDLDEAGNLYIADRCNERIRRVDARTGIITTVAGNGDRGPSADGPALETSLMGPYYVRSVSAEELIFTDTDAHRVRQLDLGTRRITTLAGSGEGGFGGDGGPALEARLARPHVAFRARNGDLIIGDSFNQRIRRVSRASGIIRTIAGSGERGSAEDSTPALEAPFEYFGDITELDDGDLLFTEWVSGRLLLLDIDNGIVLVLAGTTDPTAPEGDGFDPRATRFGSLAGLALDDRGRVLVVDADAGLVRRIDLQAGRVETVVGRLRK